MSDRSLLTFGCHHCAMQSTRDCTSRLFAFRKRPGCLSNFEFLFQTHNMGFPVQMLLVCLVFVCAVDCGRIQSKPVYERFTDSAELKNDQINNQKELKQLARAHVQNQQRRFNLEKSRRHKAMMQHAQTQNSMDSYLKAYQDQQDSYQRDVERKISSESNKSIREDKPKSLKDFANAQWWKPYEQTRSKRVETEDANKAASEKRAVSHTQTPYTLSPSYYFMPMYANSYDTSDISQGGHVAEAEVQQPQYAQLVHYKNSDDIRSLSALLGKHPNDQLKGFEDLLKPKTQYELHNTNINLGASSLDDAHTKYVYQTSYDADEEAKQQYGYTYKDHTPIEEKVNDVVNTQQQVKYVYATEAPVGHTSSSNYYKVEVANHVISEEPKSELKFLHTHTTNDENVSIGNATNPNRTKIKLLNRNKRDVQVNITVAPSVEPSVKLETDIFITAEDFGITNKTDGKDEEEFYYYDDDNPSSNETMEYDEYDFPDSNFTIGLNDSSVLSNVTSGSFNVTSSNSSDVAPHFESLIRIRKTRRPLFRIYKGIKSRIRRPNEGRFRKYLVNKPKRGYNTYYEDDSYERHLSRNPYLNMNVDDYEESVEYEDPYEEDPREYEDDDDEEEGYGDLLNSGSYNRDRYAPKYESYEEYAEPKIKHKNRRPTHFAIQDDDDDYYNYHKDDDFGHYASAYGGDYAYSQPKHRFSSTPKRNHRYSHHDLEPWYEEKGPVIIDDGHKHGDKIHIAKLNIFHDRKEKHGHHHHHHHPSPHIKIKKYVKKKPKYHHRRPVKKHRSRKIPQEKKKQIIRLSQNIDKLALKLRKF